MRMSDWSSDVCSSDLTPDKPKARAWAQPGEASAVRQSEVGKCRNGSGERDLHDSAAARLGRELCARSRARTQPEFPHDGRDSHEISPTSLRDRIGSCRSSSSSSRKRPRSEEHTSELQSLMRISYAVFCLKKKK